MREFFDTSVLVPAFLADHPHHIHSLALLRQANPAGSFSAAHTLIELYATLTRLPPPYRLTPSQALEAVRTSARRLTLISLAADECIPLIERATGLNVQGGTTYDLLIASCAAKAEIDILYTWNMRHYQLFGQDIRGTLRSPDQRPNR